MNKNKALFWLIALLIVGWGIFLRLWQLNEIPPGVWYDEAYNGLDAIEAMETGNYQIFYPENNGREGLYINLMALGFKFFGINNFTLHLISALFGIGTLIGFFFLLKELRFSRLTILLSLFLLSSSFWHLNFSRIAFRAIMVPFILVWIFWFFARGFYADRKSYPLNTPQEIISFALAGFLLGLGLHTYIAFRVVPLIFVLLAILIAWKNKHFLRAYWQSALVFIFFAFLAALPLLAYFQQHASDFVGRSQSVSVLNTEEMKPWQALGKSTAFHLGAFLFAGDPNQRHNHSVSSLIPTAWSVLFVLGFCISAKEIFTTLISRKRKISSARFFPAAIIAQASFWVMLIPGILGIEGIPHALRIIGTIPAVFLIIAFALENFLKIYLRIKNSTRFRFKPWRWKIMRFSFFGIIAVTVLTGFSQAYLYFNVWAKDPRTLEAFERELFDLGKTIQALPLAEKNYLVVDASVEISQDRISSNIKATEFAGYPQIKNYLFYKPFEGLAMIPCENSQVIFHRSDGWLRSQFQKKCPEKEIEKITAPGGYHEFWILK